MSHAELLAALELALEHCGDLDRAMRVAPHLAKDVFNILERDLKLAIAKAKEGAK